MTNRNACATCPLAVKQPEPPSPGFQWVLYLEGLQEAGAQIPFDYVPLEDWEGLAILKGKRNEYEGKRIKERGSKKA